MNALLLITYGLYVTVTIIMTIWVAETLYRAGRIFLIDTFYGNEELAGAINHMLRVGFYLINLGFVLLFLRIGVYPENLVDATEYLATKFGIVLLVLGAMHFFNLFNFNKIRRKGQLRRATVKIND